MFVQLQSQSNIHSPHLKPLCTTTWTCCTTSVNAVIMNYNLLLEALVAVNEMHQDEYGKRAAGVDGNVFDILRTEVSIFNF